MDTINDYIFSLYFLYIFFIFYSFVVIFLFQFYRKNISENMSFYIVFIVQIMTKDRTKHIKT
jgi:hypothetical protein